MSKPLEKQIERRMRDGIEAMGGICMKVSATGNAGIPDRLIVCGGIVRFVELKRDGGVLRPIQKHAHNKLREAGASVYVVEGMNGVEEFLELVRRGP